MKGLFLVVSVFLLTTCGLETFYYLPQLSQANINVAGGNNVSLNIPSLSQFSTLGANYSIFYRIYMSNHQTEIPLESEYYTINPTLSNDYNTLYTHANPANNTTVTTADTFKNRSYHELFLENPDSTNDIIISDVITSSGGLYNIIFPSRTGEYPYIENRGITDPVTGTFRRNNLFRAGENDNNNGIKFDQEPSRNFFYSPELIEKTDHPNFVNNDVALRNQVRTDEYAYVSMYIVSVGQNPVNFQRIFSKPTHISVFRLTNLY